MDTVRLSSLRGGIGNSIVCCEHGYRAVNATRVGVG